MKKKPKRQEEAQAAHTAQEQEQQAKKDLEQANFYLSKGIQPEVWATEKQLQSAKTRIQHDPVKFHFAIYGMDKSSLINAFRGLKNSDFEACTGVIPTTSFPIHVSFRLMFLGLTP